ncbi:UNVERIFIED_ORG: glycine/D-amino acid oxidase-like deaminating enzyme [Burkholderia sp. CF145]|uniref:NAD(P)/FAD-dependent oxidoreductase n=1 Tax=Paraburkholderia hospita TaxID=169430 RepID=UPI000271BE3A|nr:FAD-dependent oxidoreductase [Paraburkholderia hospita]EUC16872.1 FAD dependent oxidoreductase [Burkholderia sp. BT03]SKD03701.1 Glycine/D-amino acid oxidase [Paraburkholderia hospita]
MTRNSSANPDVLVLGGGLVGSAVAWGLAREGAQVTVLDQDDGAFRASRGNFGLVWIQGKGYGLSPYARWSRSSATRWPALAAALLDETGIDVALRQPGGFHFCFSDDDLADRAKRLGTMQRELGDYPYQLLDAREVRERLPQIGPDVIGASYTPMDGHVNPLKLLRALHTGMQQRGVKLVNNEEALRITPDSGGFAVQGKRGTYRAARVVLAAGLGNRALAPHVGLHAPVAPNRGQVLISERVAPFLHYPTLNVRQTDEGTVQFGDSMEEVGLNDFTTTHVLSDIARRGVRAFPMLKNVRLVRTWAALRVYSPDGFPIYDQSAVHPGAFVVTCHSGVTLAAAHALRIAPWITGGAMPDELPAFSGARFTESPALIPAH